jgi:transcriptional regulator with XRE-family HTH domain
MEAMEDVDSVRDFGYAPLPHSIWPCPLYRQHLMEAQNYMVIGDRLRELRERKKLSQGDIEKRTGLIRCYVSRVENGHTIPSIETLEKMAHALEVPLYQLFYDGEKPPDLPNLIKRKSADDIAWGSKGKDARWLVKLRRFLSRMSEHDRKIVMFLVQKMAKRPAGRN